MQPIESRNKLTIFDTVADLTETLLFALKSEKIPFNLFGTYLENLLPTRLAE
jgi:hypothetical protein